MLKNFNGLLQRFSEKLTYRHWLIIAGAASLLLGILVFFSLGSEEDKKPSADPAPKNLVTVVAATKNIKPRTIIDDKMLTLIQLPREVVPDGAIADIGKVVKNPAAVIIMKGDIITKQKLMSDPRMAGFVGMIPPDCRAVSVAISDVTGVAGFATAGDFVDVMVVTGRKEEGRLVGKFVLQNVLLLGINKSGGAADEKPADSQNENGGNIKAAREAMTTATLALTPNDALRLATTSQNGIVYLALRPYKPKEEVVVAHDYVLRTEKPNEYRRDASPSSQPLPPRGSHPATGSGTVEVIRGTTATREGGR